MADASGTAAPKRAGLVLLSLILVAGVANLNLSVANVALPSMGKHFGAIALVTGVLFLLLALFRMGVDSAVLSKAVITEFGRRRNRCDDG